MCLNNLTRNSKLTGNNQFFTSSAFSLNVPNDYLQRGLIIKSFDKLFNYHKEPLSVGFLIRRSA